MGNKSIIHDTGARVKNFFGGDNRRGEGRDSRREVRGSRNSMRRQNDGFEDGFENVSDSDWLFGFVFLVLIIVALSPGILLTIPPGRGGLFMSGNTSTIAAFVHAVLLIVLLNML